MNRSLTASPFGTSPVSGIEHISSPHPVTETVASLTEAIASAGAKLFAVIDHSGEAKIAGLALHNTKVLIYGNPIAGTPVMQTAPLSALDLPLKILVWADDAGAVFAVEFFASFRAPVNPTLSLKKAVDSISF
jgi:uncharacterized protein (DUF302 family)